MFIEDELPIRIIGIDPGTTSIGLCVGEIVEVEEIFILRILDSYTVNTPRLVRREYKEYEERFGERAACIKAGLDAIFKYIEVWRPIAVGYEDSYLGQHASSYGSGIEIQAKFVERLKQYSQFLKYLIIDPSTVKTAVGVSGTSKQKADITKGITSTTDLDISQINLDLLTEHAKDSIAIAKSLFNNITGKVVYERRKSSRRPKRRRTAESPDDMSKDTRKNKRKVPRNK